MEEEIYIDEEGNTWVIDYSQLDPNGEPLIVPYEEV